jgi:hypothetical protein
MAAGLDLFGLLGGMGGGEVNYVPIGLPIFAGPVASGPPIDHSGSITTGGLAQTVMAANPVRRSLFFQNVSEQELWVNAKGGTAAVGEPNIRLNPFMAYEPTGNIPTGAVSVFGATTGQQFVAEET